MPFKDLAKISSVVRLARDKIATRRLCEGRSRSLPLGALRVAGLVTRTGGCDSGAVPATGALALGRLSDLLRLPLLSVQLLTLRLTFSK